MDKAITRRDVIAGGEHLGIAALMFYLTVAIVADGGVGSLSKSILAILAVAFCAAQIGRRCSLKVMVVSVVAQVSLAFLMGAVFVQSLRGLSLALNPVWDLARQSLPDVNGAISVAPEQSLQAIVTLAPIFIFVGVLKLCRKNMIAVHIIQLLGVLATTAAVFGLLSLLHVFEFFGAAPKQFYHDSLTSFFVNRNTAGTFFGLGSLVSFSLLLHRMQIRNLTISNIWQALLDGRKIADKFPVANFAFLTINCLALALTQSRGAVASTVLCIFVYWLLAQKPRQEAVSYRQSSGKLIRLAKAATALLLVVGVAALLAGRVLHRQDAEGVDVFRLCTYQATWQMALDNWPTGSGFGTFSNLFPAYRNPACSGLWGHWEMAHNFFLEGLQSLGAVFCALVFACYSILIWAFGHGLKHRSRNRYLSALGICALLLVSVHSLVDFSLQIPGVANYVAVLLGACVAVSLNPGRRKDRKGSRSHQSSSRNGRKIVLTPHAPTGPFHTTRGAASFTPNEGETQPPPFSGSAPQKS